MIGAIRELIIVVRTRLTGCHTLESGQRIDDRSWQRIIATAIHDDMPTVEIVGICDRVPERLIRHGGARSRSVGNVRSCGGAD